VDLVHDSTDVAVRIARTLGPNLIARKISPVPMIVCASPAYLARRGVPLVPEDLALHDTLGYSYLLTGDNWVFHHRDGQESAVRIQPAVHATNGDLLRALAVGGEGITVQPDFIVRDDLAAGRLVPLLNDWHMGEFYLYAVYLSRKHLSAKVRAFIDYLAETLCDQAS
jgi:DNA-binding transcriptional LysR family regulator